MAVVTLYRLAEQAFSLIEGGDPGAASSIDMNTLKIACGQVINKLLKIEHLTVANKTGEIIPNGSVIGTYENIEVRSWITGRSKATLPIKPMKLLRGMGIWSVYRTNDPGNEFIPIQAGQTWLIKSQPMLNNLLGQIGYEPLGNMEIAFTKDLPLLFPNETIEMRLIIMDISQYDDYDPLPLPPEFEWDVLTEVYKMYSSQPIPDKLVEATSKENKNVPLREQKQS